MAPTETIDNERANGASTSSTYYTASGSVIDEARVESPFVGRGRGALGTGINKIYFIICFILYKLF